ncbi:hypothetical protein AV530_017102 [Patagioenas fasciata monilis]|uniref:Uncharacterized protein n=1 Tax=Patagioenas fasciata monilis TaxID=372326 RepID=A0A1V4J2V2_PATFA|nr:hypothetical protein AV530_017102 [Patagioenas fasciata monilis]
MWGTRATFMEQEQQAPSHNGPKVAQGRGAVLTAAEEGKKPPGTSANLPRGKKFLPDPSAGDRLFPEHGSKTWLLVPQAGRAAQEVPKPYSPLTWSPLRGF